MRLAIALAMLLGCDPPGPGETRCAVIGGVMHCRSGPVVVQQAPVAPAPKPPIWCFFVEHEYKPTRLCRAERVSCEETRADTMARPGWEVTSQCFEER